MDDIKKILDNKSKNNNKKPPAYEWQDLALKIIKELNIPNFKRSSVFKACRDNSQTRIIQALTDTKELCQTGQKWQYFFKIINPKK
jgi:hypothetical protein